jgi:ribosomal protein S18 acetylase RimI-like enzyme
MFSIKHAQIGDVGAAVGALGRAFGGDPLMAYFFAGSPREVDACVADFLSILLRVRLALGMPALVLAESGRLLGAAMGYDVTRPAWPEALGAEWRRFEAATPGLAGRLAEYEAISAGFEPGDPHFYLGVIGVDPAAQGRGAGRALLDAFCDASRAEAKSAGVYLETGSPSSLAFYLRNGFEVRGEGRLGTTSLWCLYRPTR